MHACAYILLLRSFCSNYYCFIHRKSSGCLRPCVSSCAQHTVPIKHDVCARARVWSPDRGGPACTLERTACTRIRRTSHDIHAWVRERMCVCVCFVAKKYSQCFRFSLGKNKINFGIILQYFGAGYARVPKYQIHPLERDSRGIRNARSNVPNKTKKPLLGIEKKLRERKFYRVIRD